MARHQGQHVPADQPRLAGAVEPRGEHHVLLAQRQEPAAHHPRQIGPGDAGENDGDHEVAFERSDLVGGTAAARPIQSGRVGIDMKISTTRWMTVSTLPPK